MDRRNRQGAHTLLAILATAGMASVPLDASAQGASHDACEADEGHQCCAVRITIGLPGGELVSFAEVGRIFPEWEAVERTDPDYTSGRAPNAVLEGTVAAPENADDTG